MSLKESIKNAQIDLIKELGIDELPQEQKEETLIQISEVLQQRIVLRIVEELPADKKEEFANAVNDSEAGSAAVDLFLTENLPNVEELILDEIGKYKIEMVEFLSNSSEKSIETVEIEDEEEE